MKWSKTYRYHIEDLKTKYAMKMLAWMALAGISVWGAVKNACSGGAALEEIRMMDRSNPNDNAPLGMVEESES